MSATAREVSWDDPTITYEERSGGGDLLLFRLEKDEVARICLISEKADMVLAHYIGAEKKKKYYRCRAQESDGCPACEHVGEPKNRFGVNVLWYTTDKGGLPKNPLEVKIALWTFGNDKFTQLRAAKQEWGDLRRHDIRAHCTDKGYQKLVLTPCREALWLAAPNRDQIAEMIKKEKYEVLRIIGKVWTRAEMLKVLREGDNSIASDPQVDAISNSPFVDDSTGVAEETLPEADFDDLLAEL